MSRSRTSMKPATVGSASPAGLSRSRSLPLISVSFVSGDMAVAAIVYLACALLLRIRNGTAVWKTFACLGLVLGLGYLTKAVMFLMSIPFFVVAAAAQRSLGRSVKPVA